MRRIIMILLIGIMLLLTMTVSGCTTTQVGDVKTADDASDAIRDVGNEMGEIQDILGDIDQDLG